MRLNAENLDQIKELFDRSVNEMLAREDFCAKVAKMISKEVESLLQRTEQLERENHVLREKLDGLEQYTRRSSLRVHGLAEEKNENIERRLVTVFQEKMGIPITADCIDRCHRVGPVRVTTDKKIVRPVIVKFISYRNRESVFRAKAKLKGSSLVISEDLTASKYALLKAARLKYGNRNAWSHNGRIFVNDGGTRQVRGSLLARLLTCMNRLRVLYLIGILRMFR